MNLKTNKVIWYFLLILSLLIVTFSAPLAYSTLDLFYSNLSTESNILLTAFIVSYLISGILIYILAMNRINKE